MSDLRLKGKLSIPTENFAVLIDKTVVNNGTYNANDDDADGYKNVVVSLPLGTKTVTANGTYSASSDNVRGYTSVTVNVSEEVRFQDITKANFDLLPQSTKDNGTIYYVMGGGSSYIEENATPRITTDNGRMTASSTQNTNYAPWYTINNVVLTYRPTDNRSYASCWRPANSDTASWLKYHFAEAKHLSEYRFGAWTWDDFSFTVEIQGSNDNSTWENIILDNTSYSCATTGQADNIKMFNVPLDPTNTYEYVRIIFNCNLSQTQNFLIDEVYIYEQIEISNDILYCKGVTHAVPVE